jgi:hypothetical protein
MVIAQKQNDGAATRVHDTSTKLLRDKIVLVARQMAKFEQA